MESILIASNSRDTFGIISNLLKSNSFSKIVTAASAARANRELLEGGYDLVVIDTPLQDELGDTVALKAVEEHSGGVILLVDEYIYYDVNANMEDKGIFVLPKPVSPMFFYQACKLVLSTKVRIGQLEAKVAALSTKVEEEHLIGRAKCLLVEHKGLSEARAHRYIEKEAMDKRVSKVIIARSVIKNYDFSTSRH